MWRSPPISLEPGPTVATSPLAASLKPLAGIPRHVNDSKRGPTDGDEGRDDLTGPWVLALGTLLVGAVAVGAEVVRRARRGATAGGLDERDEQDDETDGERFHPDGPADGP